MKQKLILGFSLALMLLAAGCSAGAADDKKGEVVDSSPVEQTNDEEATGEVIGASSQRGHNVLDAAAAGTGVVEKVLATDYTNETGGQMLIDLTNTTAENIYVTIPCGLVFSPQDTSYQNMMVIQEITVEIGPGETVTIDTYVVCITGDLAWPTNGAAYTISGYVEDTDMLALAQCVCSQPVDMLFTSDETFNMMSVQTAAWVIEDPENAAMLAEFATYAGDFADLFGQAVAGEEGGEAVGASSDQLVASMTTGAQAVLDACMIEIAQE